MVRSDSLGIDDSELVGLPLEVVAQLSKPVRDRAVALLINLGFRPVFRGSDYKTMKLVAFKERL